MQKSFQAEDASDEAADQAELPPFLSDATLFDIAGEAISCMSPFHSFSLFCVSQDQCFGNLH